MTSSGGESAGRQLRIGDKVSATFPVHDPQGHEQQGSRLAVVVGLPEHVGTPRFGIVLLAPMTSDTGQSWADQAPALYPRYPAGTAGLRSDSICLLDQTRALSVERLQRYHGSLSTEEYRPIREGLGRMMGICKDVAEISRSVEKRDETGDE